MRENKLRRKDSFFGLHFDFHAGAQCKTIGEKITYDMVEKIIQKAEPDYIQCDCKGHRGLSSYPTKVGNPAPGVVADGLKVWRKATEDHNVALFLHYSGIWDYEAVAQHPEWSCVNADGTPNEKASSVFGEYSDQLLIPQLKELAGEYGADGVWLDGECWGECRDYSEKALQKFAEATGITEIPRKETDTYFHEFSDFLREAFFVYLNHYVSEVKREYPDFQIASNWAFTASHMPEKVRGGVDFVSGDIVPEDTLNAVRVDARYLAWQKAPWDLMAWADGGSTEMRSDKPAVMLKQEAAMVLSQGGGFQVYYHQCPDGYVEEERYQNITEIAEFCRSRQAFCHKQTIRPGVGLYLSAKSLYREQTEFLYCFGKVMNNIRCIAELLCKNQYNVNVISEHHIEEDIQRFPVIVIPQWAYLDEVDKFKEYVYQGGNLVVIGAESTRFFEKELGVTFVEPSNRKMPVYLEMNGMMTTFHCPLDFAEVQAKEAKVMKKLHTSRYRDSKQYVAATVNEYGKGKIAGVYFDFACEYKNARTSGVLHFVKEVLEEVYQPEVTVTGSSNVDVSVGDKDGRMLINLVNTAGNLESADRVTFDELPQISNIKVKIKADKEPEKITLQPSGKDVTFEYSDNTISLEIDKIEIYDILVVE